MRRLLPLALCAFLASPARAQVGIFTSLDPEVGCNTTGESNTGYIIVADGWKGARFSLPPQFTCSRIWIAEVMDGVTAVGDFETGIELTLPECAATRTVVATVFVGLWVSPGTDCCPIALQPHAESVTGKVELVDCSSNIVPAAWTLAIWTGSEYSECFARFMPPPQSPFPPDGATDVPLDADLSWRLDLAMGCPDLGERMTHFHFGTDPRPPFVEYITAQNYDPGLLQPETTYYWQIGARDYGADTRGPVWSFRTVSSTATESTTWGRVKALYR